MQKLVNIVCDSVKKKSFCYIQKTILQGFAEVGIQVQCLMSMDVNNATARSRFKAEGLSPCLSWLIISCLLEFPPVFRVGPTASFSALKHCLGFPFSFDSLFRNSVCAYPYRDSYVQVLDALGSFGTNGHYMNTRLDFSINCCFSSRQKQPERQRVSNRKVGGHHTSLSFENTVNSKPRSATATRRGRTEHCSSLKDHNSHKREPNAAVPFPALPEGFQIPMCSIHKPKEQDPATVHPPRFAVSCFARLN